MNFYFVSEMIAHDSKQQAEWSFLSEDERSGYLRLYNKNAAETYFIKIVRKSDTAHGWIVECEKPPEHFSRCFHLLGKTVGQ